VGNIVSSVKVNIPLRPTLKYGSPLSEVVAGEAVGFFVGAAVGGAGVVVGCGVICLQQQYFRP
jgi:hypothetical protein